MALVATLYNVSGCFQNISKNALIRQIEASNKKHKISSRQDDSIQNQSRQNNDM